MAFRQTKPRSSYRKDYRVPPPGSVITVQYLRNLGEDLARCYTLSSKPGDQEVRCANRLPIRACRRDRMMSFRLGQQVLLCPVQLTYLICPRSQLRIGILGTIEMLRLAAMGRKNRSLRCRRAKDDRQQHGRRDSQGVWLRIVEVI